MFTSSLPDKTAGALPRSQLYRQQRLQQRLQKLQPQRICAIRQGPFRGVVYLHEQPIDSDRRGIRGYHAVVAHGASGRTLRGFLKGLPDPAGCATDTFGRCDCIAGGKRTAGCDGKREKATIHCTLP